MSVSNLLFFVRIPLSRHLLHKFSLTFQNDRLKDVFQHLLHDTVKGPLNVNLHSVCWEEDLNNQGRESSEFKD